MCNFGSGELRSSRGQEKPERKIFQPPDEHECKMQSLERKEGIVLDVIKDQSMTIF